jgi:PAS domain S-box-containing protein
MRAQYVKYNDWARYLLGILISGVAIFLQVIIEPIVGEIYFLLLYPAIVICAWWLGPGPGILSALVCTIGSDFFFFSPRYNMTIPDNPTFIRLLTFFSSSAFMSYLVGKNKIEVNLRQQKEQELEKILKDLTDFKFAIDQASILATTDANGVITYVNDKFCAISKYSREELMGKTHTIINSGYHSTQFFQGLWKTIRSGEIWHGEIKNRAKDGTYYWMDTFIVPFLDNDRRPYQYVAIRNDITKRVNQQEQLRKAVRSRDEFLSIASHELKTPLTSLQLRAQMLLRHKEKLKDGYEQKIFEFAQAIEHQTKRLSNLVEDMLDLGRLRSGSYGLEMQNYHLRDLMEKILNQMEPVFRVYSLPIPDLSCEPGIHVYVDKSKFEQVINNLLTNAIKYGQGKAIKLEVIPHPHEVEVAVSDQGLGIEQPHLERIFERYERAISPNEVSGLGLGLFITKEIVVAHGGRIWVDSKVNEGSTFHFTVRRAPQEN